MLVDTHCHLDFLASDGQDIGDVLKKAKDAGVSKIICVGTSIDASKKCVDIAQKYSTSEFLIYATCGIHPQDGKDDIKKYGDNYIDELKKVAQSSNKIVGIGETGLDYYLTGDKLQLTSDQEKGFQGELFLEQVELAADLNLPLLIHCRNGWSEVFDLLSNVNSSGKAGSNVGLFHSWTGDWDAAQKALDLGFYISFSGILTFKNAPLVQEVAKKAPIDRILVETDSPFLSPEPHRGEKNSPENVKITAQFLADLRGVPIDKIAEATTDNAKELFKI